MEPRRADWLRLLLLLPLVLAGLWGRGRLQVDAENLAMKSVGTAAEAGEELRVREFGERHDTFLLAVPRAPELRSGIDEERLVAWTDDLRRHAVVEAVEELPAPADGSRFLVLSVRADADGRYATTVAEIEAAARAALPATHSLHVGGVPPVELAIANEVARERQRILPLLVVCLCLALLVVYRSPLLVASTLLAPLVGVLVVEGVQGFLGLGLDPVSALLGPSLLTVGVAAGVHLLERYRDALRSGETVAVASRTAASSLRTPLLLGLVTTVAGFLGLLLNPIPAVERFGLLASFGITVVTLVTLVCVPALYRLLHVAPARPTAGAGTRRTVRLVPPLPVLAGVVLLLVPALLSVPDVRVDANPLNVLGASHPARLDVEEIARTAGASESFDLLLGPDGPAGPLPTVPLVGALVGAIGELEGVLGPARAPRSSPGGYRLLSFLLDPDAEVPRATVFARAEDVARAAGWSEAHATGLVVRTTRDSTALVRGQRRGVLATTLALWLVMAIGLRSVWLGALGLVPNLLPLLLVQGGMAWLDLPLTVAASMIGTVMLGLVVDDTIHLLHRYARTTGTVPERLGRTLAEVRRPIVITTVVLVLGFGTTLAGDLRATREFGALAVATLSLALVADLFVLPACLLLAGGSRRRAASAHPVQAPR